MFNGREASRVARAFRRRGLRGSADTLVEAVRDRGVDGASVLEVGGGVGHVHVSLLEAGAERAMNVDLSSSWEDEAGALLAERGLSDRVDRRIADFVDEAGDLPDADVVIMHRVVCCYPDMPGLVRAGASRARRLVALTVPRETWLVRVVLRLENAFMAMRRRSFRAYVHPRRGIRGVLADEGFALVDVRTSFVWSTMVFERA
jgi:magnesium-protoporphyrin O-methyltransferase